MGKYERGWSDKAEIGFAKSIGGDILYSSNFDRGDVVKDGVIYEVKASGGSGTLANIGQDFMTDVGCCFNAENWSDFRKKTGFDDYRFSIVKSLYIDIKTYTEFLNKYVDVFKESNEKEKKAIEHAAKEDKISYLKLLKSSEQKNAKEFYINAINGSLKKKEYRSSPVVDENYKVVSVDKDGNIIKQIKYFFDDSCQYVFSFRDDITSFFLSAIINDTEVKLLRFQLHWKNKFQGGKTPCINVFYVGP